MKCFLYGQKTVQTITTIWRLRRQMSVFPLLSDFREGEHAYPPPADKKTVVGSAPLLKVPHVKHDIVGCVGLPVGQLPMETR